MVQFTVRSVSNHMYNSNDGDKAGVLKTWISNLENLPEADVTLYCQGKPVGDNDMLASLPVHILDVNVGLKGGKVHGSLARAGKVKGQTPKVDKQEKKKTVVGRARRRIQYNRRFVNVIQTFGRRKGPNSNS